VWPAGAGISYRRLERGGLQWPCPTEDHPGTPILHLNGFAKQPRAALALVPYVPTTERTDQQFPMTLITGRSLYHFNAGTMTMHTPNRQLRPEDLLEVCAEDAAALGLPDGCPVRIVSRWGEATLPLQITDRVSRGEVFATFHTLKAQLNRVTSPHRDRVVDTPEYKITAVRLEAAPLVP
jgi:formate dehydrogenase major subunit